MKFDWTDLFDRVGWTTVQGAAGLLTGHQVAEVTGAADWRALLVGTLAAALLSLLKVLGVKASHLASARASLDKARELPALASALDALVPLLDKLDDSPAGAVAVQALKQAVAELEGGADTPKVRAGR